MLLLYVISLPILGSLNARIRPFRMKTVKNLYWFHMLFALIYYIMTRFSASDSIAYYQRTLDAIDGWLSIYDTGTPFIDFFAYPFVNYLHFSYEMMMVLFAWLGYWGFIFFYIFFIENVRHKHSLYGIDLITLFIFLPNMHYWTASLGKGSIIFWGIGLAVYGLSKLTSRKMALIAGLLIVYHVRPHVFMFLCAGILVGLFTGRQRVPLYQKLLVLTGSIIALALLYKEILAFSNLDSENILESFDQLSSHKSVELAKSGSGIDISGYPLPLKLFTFWFRPLFVDAPGPVGLIVSVENLLYLFLCTKLFNKSFVGFITTSPATVKASLFIFLSTSLAFCGTLSNLGIIIRQKSMVMYFFLFIVIGFLDHLKTNRLQKKKKALAAFAINKIPITTSR